jgi:hypothetical protein
LQYRAGKKAAGTAKRSHVNEFVMAMRGLWFLRGDVLRYPTDRHHESGKYGERENVRKHPGFVAAEKFHIQSPVHV